MRLLVIASLLVVGCGPLRQLRHAPAPASPVVAAPTRPVPYPVFETKAFARAVARGTRTRTGEPGPNYWQQFARYRIDAELVPSTSQITGRESVRYFNHSPDTLRSVWVFLNQNLFAPTSPRVVPTPVTGGMEILRVAAGGKPLTKADSGAGYLVEGTTMWVGLPKPLSPNDSLDLDIAWAFQLPPDGAPREGSTGDVLMVAYWYPQLAVYDDVNGWQKDPYLGGAEFYMGYADYDVNLSVPQGWLIAATGELTNAQEILDFQQLVRMVPIADSIARYVVAVVRATRHNSGGAPDIVKKYVNYGGSVRAAQFIVLAAKARALARGRYHVAYEDVTAAVIPVLRHRILLNFHAESDRIDSDEILRRLLETMPPPKES